MEVRADALSARLQRQCPKFAWVHGDEPLLRIEAGDALRAAARGKGFVERTLIDVDRQFGAGVLAAQAGTMSLFAERRLVEIRFPAGTKPGKEAARTIADFTTHAGDDQFVLVSSLRLDRAVRESPALAELDRLGWIVPVYPITLDALPAWLAGRLKQQNQQASPATLRELADRVEGNLLAAAQELRKIALMLPAGQLDEQAVRQLTAHVARYDPNQFVEAMLTGDTARALRSLDGLRGEGEPLPRLVWFVADALRQLVRLHAICATGMPVGEALRSLRVFPQAKERALEAAWRASTPASAAQALQTVAGIDRIAKGVGRDCGSGDAWQELIRLSAVLR